MILDAIGSLFRNQSIENPSTPIGWGMFSDSGVESSSGVMVSRMNALGFHPYYRGMDLVSSYVGKLPLHVERVGDGVREKATSHPNYNHLLWRPSPEMSALQWKKSMEFLRMDEGNGYTFLRRLGNGTITEFVLLNAAETWPVRANGKLYYLTKRSDGQDQLMLREDVIHIRNLCGSELRGYGLRHLGRNSIGAGIATIEYRARFFRNGAAPLVVIEVPGDLPPDRKKALADGWNQIHAGVSQAHKTGVLTNGAKANILSANAQQNQLTEQEKFSIIEVSNLIGIPPHKLGDGSRTAYNSLEQENQSFLDDSLDWRLVDWEQELWDKVLTEQQKRDRSYEICFDREQLIRADLAAMGTFLSQAVGGPVLTVDEGREKLRMNKRPGLEGDVLYGPGGAGVPNQPASTAPPAEIVDGPEDVPSAPRRGMSNRVTDSHRALLARSCQKMAERIAKSAANQSRKPADLQKEIESLEKKHKGVLVSEFSAVLAACNAAAGVDSDEQVIAERLIRMCARDLLTIGASATANGLEGAVAEWAKRFPESASAELVAFVFKSELREAA